MTQGPLQRLLVRRAAAMNTKAARLHTPGRVSSADLAKVLIESEGVCNYCGIELPPLEGSFDHVVPFDKGGFNEPENIVRACFTCNRTKHTKSPEELAAYQVLRVTCIVCGKEFRPRWADWKRGFGKTCSRTCAGVLGGRQ